MSHARGSVVLVELNEVPNPVLDAYAEKSTFLAELLAHSDRYTTVTPDKIQLDPWIAWPTLHRGVNDEQHGILRLGQDTSDADAAYPPIWRILRDHEVSVGVYGSLFSSSEEDLSGYAFFVPDVFSPHDRVLPQDLRRFQSFNLTMTRASSRNVADKVAGGGLQAIGGLAARGHLTLATLGRVAAQLIEEKLDSRKHSRRRNLQTELQADVFCKLLKRQPAAFSTFYTNNVAASMHRFWSASVPGAKLNRERISQEWLDTYCEEVFVALSSVERLIARLVSGEFGPTTVLIASALGQEEIPAENYSRFLTITDVQHFVRAMIGTDDLPQFSSLPTMVPDFTLRFDDPADAAQLVARLAVLRIAGEPALETVERMHHKAKVGSGDRMSYIRYSYIDEAHFKYPATYKQSDPRTVHISLQFDDYAGPQEVLLGNEVLPFANVGLGFVPHDEGVNCTAQHTAAGSLVVSRPSGARDQDRAHQISVLDVSPSLLSHFGIAIPDYMRGEPAIRL